MRHKNKFKVSVTVDVDMEITVSEPSDTPENWVLQDFQEWEEVFHPLRGNTVTEKCKSYLEHMAYSIIQNASVSGESFPSGDVNISVTSTSEA